MAPPNLQVELVFDPLRHRTLIGRSNDLALLRATALQLMHEAERHAEQFDGLNDVAAAEERAEADRLRRLLAVVFPGEEMAG